jgi:hypothetical protein
MMIAAEQLACFMEQISIIAQTWFPSNGALSV